MLAIGALASACSDDTTSPAIGGDMSIPKDLSTPAPHDMAQPID